MGHVFLATAMTDDMSDIWRPSDRVSVRTARLIDRRDLVVSGLKYNEGKSNWDPDKLGSS